MSMNTVETELKWFEKSSAILHLSLGMFLFFNNPSIENYKRRKEDYFKMGLYPRHEEELRIPEYGTVQKYTASSSNIL